MPKYFGSVFAQFSECLIIIKKKCKQSIHYGKKNV